MIWGSASGIDEPSIAGLPSCRHARSLASCGPKPRAARLRLNVIPWPAWDSISERGIRTMGSRALVVSGKRGALVVPVADRVTTRGLFAYLLSIAIGLGTWAKV